MPAGDGPRVSAAVEIEHWATSPGAVLGAFLVFAQGIFSTSCISYKWQFYSGSLLWWWFLSGSLVELCYGKTSQTRIVRRNKQTVFAPSGTPSNWNCGCCICPIAWQHLCAFYDWLTIRKLLDACCRFSQICKRCCSYWGTDLTWLGQSDQILNGNPLPMRNRSES